MALEESIDALTKERADLEAEYGPDDEQLQDYEIRHRQQSLRDDVDAVQQLTGRVRCVTGGASASTRHAYATSLSPSWMCVISWCAPACDTLCIP